MPSSNALHATLQQLDKKHNHNNWPCRLWVRRYKTRKQLKALQQDDPERLLRDLGLHPDNVQRECKKWFWQA